MIALSPRGPARGGRGGRRASVTFAPPVPAEAARREVAPQDVERLARVLAEALATWWRTTNAAGARDR
jgi:hypothetical protein